MPVFKTGCIMVYQCPTVRPFHMFTYSVLFQHKYCINVPIHVYGAAVGEI
jgi:hypothetical protein